MAQQGTSPPSIVTTCRPSLVSHTASTHRHQMVTLVLVYRWNVLACNIETPEGRSEQDLNPGQESFLFHYSPHPTMVQVHCM